MRGIVQYFIKNPIAGNIIMFLILIFGAMSLGKLKSTFFPEVESRIITVTAVYPGSSPEEVERGIVLKVEKQLEGLTGVERVSSVSSENLGLVTVEVIKGYDPEKILQDVKGAVDRISDFPVGLEKIDVVLRENINFAISFALSGRVDLKRLKEVARKVEDELIAKDGISKVEIGGFPDEELEIAFRENDLLSHNLTLAEATQAVRNANIEVTGGTIKGNTEELRIRANAKEYYADELKDIIVKTSADGGVVRLGEVADVRDKWADNPNRRYMNGEPAVIITVNNTLEEDMLSIAEEVRQYIVAYNERGGDIKATIVRDGSITLRQRIDLLTSNGIQGFFLVLIFLALFLHWRIAFWVALSIPISFAGMFIYANFAGLTINVISLFGMILVVGILVDDGIVISENIYQHYEKGKDRWQAAIDGTMEVLPAVVSAVLTTVIAFSAFFFLDGTLGERFADLAVVVILTLVVSLIEAIFILPGHIAHSKALDKEIKPNKIVVALDKFLFWTRDTFYAPLLRFSLKHYGKLIPLVTLIGLLMLTFAGFSGGKIRSTFFPNISRDDITVSLRMPAGTREHITEDWLNKIEQTAWEVNKSLSAARTDGNQTVLKIEKIMGPSTYEGSLNITLLDGETRKLSDLIIADSIRSRVGPVPGSESLTYGSRSFFGKPVSISLLGNDFDQLNKATAEIKAAVSAIEGLKDVVDNNQEGLREIDISLKEKARILGVSLQDIIGQVRQGFFGAEVQRLQRGEDEVKVWVRYTEAERNNIGQLENMRIRLAGGQVYQLSELATLTQGKGVIAINHIDGKREVKIEADIANKEVSTTDITTLIKTKIVPEVLAKYPNVSVLYEGQNREQMKTSRSLMAALPVIFLIMFFVIALTFGSWGQAVVVMLMIPFGFIGVGFGHYIMDAQFSLFSVLGVVALVGVLVNDALVYVSTYNDYIKGGMPHMSALYETGLSRYRAILLTSVTTIAGLGPIMFSTSFQAQFLIPMAISIAYGLFATTLITLFLIPVSLAIQNRIKRLMVWAWYGKKPSYEEVEVHSSNKLDYNFIYIFVILLIVVFAWTKLM